MLLAAYRRAGADLPWGDPRRYHGGGAVEGYFWRFTDARAGRSVIATFDQQTSWPARRALGGSGPGHLVPGLNQYRHRTCSGLRG